MSNHRRRFARRLGVAALLTAALALAPPVAAQTPGAAPAAPSGDGTVQGIIIDEASVKPLTVATIEAVGRTETARTDNSGQYKLALPPGTYELRVYAPLYRGMRLQNVQVFAGRATRVDAALTPVGEAGIQMVEVVAVAAAETERTQLLQRQKASGVSDNISKEAMAKSTDSDVAEAVTRAPAITLNDDKFIVVRGLGERYSIAQLNGSRLPSTDPNKRIPPFDIFPADFVGALNIIKSYTPDLPGDFSGALIEIKLAEPPPKFTYSLGASMGFNTETTFRTVNSYDSPCPAADWFTFGNDCRSLPSLFGDAPSLVTRDPTTPQMRALVGSLPNNWNIDAITAPPNFNVKGSVGSTFGPFGFNLAASYGTKWSIKRGAVNNTIANVDDSGSEYTLDVFNYDISSFETQLGALLTTQYEISADHVISGRGLVNRAADDEVQVGRGRLEADVSRIDLPSSSIYTLNQLGFGQLEGRHHWSLADLDWRAAWAPSLQDQPDAKYLIYNQINEPPAQLTFHSPSTLRTFATLNEFLQDYAVDSTVPFETALPFTHVWSGLPARFKTGLAYQQRDRTFDYRRFSSFSTQTAPPFFGQPDSILMPDNYSVAGPLRFGEGTTQNDSFEGSEDVAGAYAMVDLPLIRDQLNFIGGSRVEYSYIVAKGFVFPDGAVKTILNNLDPLPSAILKYSPRDDMNVRAGWSQTVSRPDFRELTPTRFPALPGQRVLLGNENLLQSDITNYDLRWEWFFTPLELVSAGFFYKELTNPIELAAIVETSSYIDFYVNGEEATLWGFEIELRKNFDFAVPYAEQWSVTRPIAPNLADLQLEINVSAIQSDVTGIADPEREITVTNNSRPLLGQAPFAINAALQYADNTWGTYRLLYRTVGRTIAAAGTDVQPETPGGALPDIYKERRDQLDFVWAIEGLFGTPLTYKFGIENILNDDYLQTQGSVTVEKYRTGTTFSLGASYKF